MDPFVAVGVGLSIIAVMFRQLIPVIMAIFPLVMTLFSISTIIGDFAELPEQAHFIIYILAIIGWAMLVLFLFMIYRLNRKCDTTQA